MIKLELNQLNLPDRYSEVVEKIINNSIDLELDYLNKIILFGSLAKGKVKITSDIDIMFITDNEITDKKERQKLYSVTDNLDYNSPEVDIVIYDLDTLKNGKRIFTRDIRESGIILWERK